MNKKFDNVILKSIPKLVDIIFNESSTNADKIEALKLLIDINTKIEFVTIEE